MSSFDCPNCGPYVPCQPADSRGLSMFAKLMMRRAIRCRNCGDTFLAPNPHSFARRWIIHPLRTLFKV